MASGMQETVGICGGTGAVGTALGAALAKAGYRVMLGSRHPQSSKAQAAASKVGSGAQVATDAAVASGADVVVLAFPGPRSAQEAAALLQCLGDTQRLAGKCIIDLTNPLDEHMELVTSSKESAAQWFAAALPHSVHVYKALNSIGAVHYAAPHFTHPQPQPAAGLYAGDAAHAAPVQRLLSALGFAPQWVGPLPAARHLEALAETWIAMAYKYKALPPSVGNNFAFTVITK